MMFFSRSAWFLTAALVLAQACAAQADIIDVVGARSVLVQHYQKVAKLYRRFNALPAEDRAGLSLHVVGREQPDDKPLHSTGLHLQTQNGAIPLTHAGSDDMVFPLSDALWQENPPLMATLQPDHYIRFIFQIAITPPQQDGFTNAQATHWLKQMDNCVEDVVGFVFAFLMPDAHKLTLTLAPHSQLLVTEAGQNRTLFDNTAATAADYTIRPQDYAADATFHSTQPLERVVIKLPVQIHADMKRKAA
ncbi:DUF2987 domain-containing protein [Acetobacter senegalensis]|uniref:DUF2987 domain-containing protein n=1 Tax=Acetobacter senegalensis TaxID=446692 RepID=UPI002651DE26|nr:DUF2987 domain-containing protein [Acetobacter senegalensis]MDN7351160.1 DUF2987 domain-containing protein [Acetobacter senegalensis]